jgi:purine-nucleoside phosphorylase
VTLSALPTVDRLAGELEEHGIADFRVAFVLGSGLGAFAERLGGAREVPFDTLASLPASRVPGHAGKLVIGEIAGTRVLVQQGRVHLYEGWSAHEVTRSVRAFARVGCKALVLTNAAGGLVADWPVPSLMRVVDHINLQGRTPLLSSEVGRGTPYDEELGAVLDSAAEEAGVRLYKGVYAGLLGPSYETPAEVRLLGELGAEAVGMSTVAEALTAQATGMRTCAISCISNHAAGISATPLSHDEVVAAGGAIAGDFCDVLERAVPKLAAAIG